MNLLIIDDERSIRLSLRIGLESVADQIFEAGSGEEGLALFEKHPIDLVILDIKLPGIDGFEVLKHLKMMDQNTTVIMITYLSEVKLAVNAMKHGAYDYFTKPFSVPDIAESIDNVMAFIRKRDTVIANNTQYDSVMIGESNALNEIRTYIEKLGHLDYDTCVLIHGESGCGKEVIAQEIHRAKGVDKPFVAINCAAIPKSLQESELFGYEKGAFTEAKERKEGLIEKAHGGGLFLDEVGDMDLDLQAKLLRVLQEKRYRRIGGRVDLSFEATIIAASNKDLEKEIQEGHFRLDLFYRLNVIPIKVPPLKDRQEDIIPLVEHFVALYNEKMNRHIQVAGNDVYEALINYSWPGNVRELKNLIERIMILSNKDKITLDQIPYDMIDYIPNNQDVLSLENAEKETIAKTLIKCNWNISHSANVLGVSRLTLRRKIEKYQISK